MQVDKVGVASATIAGAAGAHVRHASDFYETPPECTTALMRHLPAWRNRMTWECACGNGMISGRLRQMGVPVISTDIRLTMESLRPVDFLSCDLPFGIEQIITNPPFDLAEAFIRRARLFRIPFAMILKSTYWHAADRRALFVETGPIKHLPLGWRPAMAPDRGNSPTMEFSWTVWGAEPATACEYYPLVKP